MTIRLVLPFPPSVNQLTTVARGRKITGGRGRAYRFAALTAIKSQYKGDAMEGRLHVTIELYPPDKRIRDVDNYSKAALDALTSGLVYGDDSQIDHLEMIRREVGKPGECVITIEELNG